MSKKLKNNKKESNKTKLEKRFSIFNWILVCLLFVSWIIDNTTPYSYIKNLIFFVLTFLLLELFLILAFLKVCLFSKNKTKRLFAFLCFIVNGIILFFRVFIYFDLLILILFTYNSVLGVYLLFYYLLYKTKKPYGKLLDRSFMIVIGFILIFAMINTFNHTYVNSSDLWIYGLIAMGVLFIIFIILSLTLFKKTYAKLAKNIWTKIGVVFIALVLSFGYGVTLIDVANTSIKSDPQKISCLIVDKDIEFGYRKITRYKLYVMINDKKITIDVSKDLYKTKEINDMLIINYYIGNLNLPYYENGETI